MGKPTWTAVQVGFPIFIRFKLYPFDNICYNKYTVFA